MRKNNKGFTMIELLAVVTIMGILMVVAVPAVTKYITKGRNQSLETMFKSSYEAAENYMMEKDILFKTGDYTITLKTLVDEQYLEPLFDPSTENRCDTNTDSKVVVTYSGTTAGGLPNYEYEVRIKCPSFDTVKIKTFPE